MDNKISGSCHCGLINFEIKNNGPELGKTTARPGKKGIGVSNTRERLKTLYGSDFTFSLENAREGGVVVKLSIPYRWEEQ